MAESGEIVQVDPTQLMGQTAATSGGPQRPGYVRPELRLDFDSTMERISSLIDKVWQLACHAETFFWDTRKSDIQLYGYATRKGEDGAKKLCEAAYPMLNEVLERLAYVSDIDDHPGGSPGDGFSYWADLGSTEGREMGDTYWNVTNSTRTFYKPTVKTVCGVLRQMVTQIGAWSTNAEGWDDLDSLASIRSIYGEGLQEFYARARAAINELGPLWALVICDMYPSVTETDQITGNLEQFAPLSCTFTPIDTLRGSLTFSAGAYSMPMSALLGDDDYTDWKADSVSLEGDQTVYKSRGGYVDILKVTDSSARNLADDDDVDYPTGIFEIYGANTTLVFSNEPLLDEAAIVQVNQDDASDEDVAAVLAGYMTTFHVRLIRKAEPNTDDVVHAQYRANLGMLNSDAELKSQNFSWEFDDSGSNEHTVPSLHTDETGYIPMWLRYDESVHDGTSVVCNTQLKDLDEQTCLIGTVISGIGFNGPVNAMAMDSSGNLYVGGSFTSVTEPDGTITARNGIACILGLTGALDATWDPDITFSVGGVMDIAISSDDDTIYVGGWFTAVGGSYRLGLAAIEGIDAGDSTGDPTSWYFHKGIVYSIELSADDNTLYVSSQTATGNVYSVSANSTQSNNSLLWYVSLNDVCPTMALSGTKLYIGGGFTTVSGTARNYLAALTAASGALESWDPDSDDYVRTLIVSGSYIYVGGDFSEVDSTAREHLAAIDTSGNVDASWEPEPNGIVHSLYAVTGGIMVGGNFTVIGDNSLSRNRIALVEIANASNTGDAQALDPDANQPVECFAGDDAVGARLCFGGGFSEVDSSTLVSAASYDVDTMTFESIPWA